MELSRSPAGGSQQQVSQRDVLIAREHHVAPLVPSEDQMSDPGGGQAQVCMGIEDSVAVDRGDQHSFRGLRLVGSAQRGEVLAEDSGERVVGEICVPGLARERLVFRRHRARIAAFDGVPAPV